SACRKRRMKFTCREARSGSSRRNSFARRLVSRRRKLSCRAAPRLSRTESGRRSVNRPRKLFRKFIMLLRKSLEAHRFHRALGKKPIDRNQTPPNCGRCIYGIVPINTSFAETARWKRCVPRGAFSFFQVVATRHEGFPG